MSAGTKEASARVDVSKRATISHYRVLERLGAGGMGEVYRAHDDLLDRDVAIKVLPADYERDANAVERLCLEARATSALSHPHIVAVYEADQTEGRHFIAMELVRGRTLRALIGQALPADTLRDVALQIARALAAAHSIGIVHRDIKPENIMVRDDGYLKVLDFGLAQINGPVTEKLATEGEMGFVTQRIFGTPRYMSPERARGQGADAATDVFSLGIVIYELSTGMHPFDAGSAYETVLSIMTNDPVAPSLLNAEIPPEFGALILRMLTKDPARRPKASEVVAALTLPLAYPIVRPARIAVGRAVSARKPSPPAAAAGSRSPWSHGARRAASRPRTIGA
jgi:eukaryotic-like serine/threonine-protein kinase